MKRRGDAASPLAVRLASSAHSREKLYSTRDVGPYTLQDLQGYLAYKKPPAPGTLG